MKRRVPLPTCCVQLSVCPTTSRMRSGERHGPSFSRRWICATSDRIGGCRGATGLLDARGGRVLLPCLFELRLYKEYTFYLDGMARYTLCSGV